MIAVQALGQIYRRLPISSGLTPLSFNSIVNRLFRGAPEFLTARLRDGTPIDVMASDYHGRILYLFGSNDLKVASSAVELSRPGDVFLDIGANYSSIGLAVARKVGADGVVHLFEPQGRIARPVEQAIRAGGFGNVHLHRLGLMDVDGSFTIKGPQAHSGRATFADHEDAANFATIETCEVRAVADYVAPLVSGRAFGAKIDIEGSEPKVMPWLLAQTNLRFMIFEAAHHHYELFEAVRVAGFKLYGLDRRLIGHRLTRVDGFATMRAFHDLVAVRTISDAVLPSHLSPARLASFLA